VARQHAQLVARLAPLRIEEAADHPDRLAGREEYLVDAAAREEPCAGGERARHVGDVHRLLRVLRAAEGAHAGAEAAALVAGDPRPRVAERRGAALEERAVAAVGLVGDGADVQLLLDALEVGAQVGSARAADAVALRPLVEHVVRGAVAGAGVDGRRAADAAAERDRDGRAAERAGQPAAPVEEVDHRARVPGEVLAGEEAAFLDQRHVAAARRELARHHRAARARAHHDHVRQLVDVVRDGGAVGHVASRAAWCAAFGPASSFRRR